MKIKPISTVIPLSSSLAMGVERMVAVAWSPDNLKLAACRRDRAIYLYNDKGEVKDKFTTRPYTKNGAMSYQVTAITFSPDSIKIAVAQTDNIIYIYKIGEDFRMKKSITNKLQQPNSVVTLVWPNDLELISGLSDGKIRHIPVVAKKGPRCQTIYNPGCYNIALTINSTGTELASSHTDGRIALFAIGDPEGPVLITVIRHCCAAYALAFGNDCLMAGGSDKKIIAYDKTGKVKQLLDFNRDKKETEFSVAVANPTGQALLFGSYNRIRILQYNNGRKLWEEASVKDCPNLYSVTSACWRKDGTLVAIGNVCGTLHLFESILKRSKNKRYETTHVSSSHVIIKLSEHKTTASMKSKYGNEIVNVRLMGKDHYAIARTSDTLLICDIRKNLVSEIPWSESDDLGKFYFDQNVCMIFNCGEMILVEYGKDEILGTFRTEYVNPHVISVRINERVPRNKAGKISNKKLAFLLDLQTIVIVDLENISTLGNVNHDSKIDWLELNETGAKLLFRDRRQRLFLVDVDSMSRHELVQMCNFVQWVPESDVIVAQSKKTILIWYNVDTPEQNIELEAKGIAFDVIKENHRTFVRVQDGNTVNDIPLDESRIEFTTGIADGDFLRAVVFLESSEPNMETSLMWKTLAKVALEARDLCIAERCYWAIGDVAKAKFLRDTTTHARNLETKKMAEKGKGLLHYQVQARVAIINGQLKTAEAIFLKHNDVDGALRMYEDLNKYEEAINLVQAQDDPRLKDLISTYLRYVISSGKYEVAAEFLEKHGSIDHAINLYLAGGLPTKASKLVEKHPAIPVDIDLLRRISNALLQGDFIEAAGDFFETIEKNSHALKCYRKAKVYDKAVKLAKNAFPNEVVPLEDEWGDYLSSNRQHDAATNHYMEAGQLIKGLDSAIESRHWKKAYHIIETVGDTGSVVRQYIILGDYFASIGDLKESENCYLNAGVPRKAVEIYTTKGEWADAYRVAAHSSSLKENLELEYIEQAELMHLEGKLLQSEKLYVAIGQPDLAIRMYAEERMHDEMLRLVASFHIDHVDGTHKLVANLMKSEDNLKGAEYHYMKAGYYTETLEMYQEKGFWEDAYRVARKHGGPSAAKNVIFLWANSLGGTTAVRLLQKFGHLYDCIDYMCEQGVFSFAEEIARIGAKEKLPEVHMYWGRYAEGKCFYQEAQDHYLMADQPRDVVNMYLRAEMLPKAVEIADKYAKEDLQKTLLIYAKALFEQGNYSDFEAMMLRAERPDIAVTYYQRHNMWTEAFKLSEEYAPHLIQQLKNEYDTKLNNIDNTIEAEVTAKE